MADVAGQRVGNERLLRFDTSAADAQTPQPDEGTSGTSTPPPPSHFGRKSLFGSIAAGLLIIALVGSSFVLHGLPGSSLGNRLPGGTLCIATDFPTSSAEDARGKPAEQGADLAISQHKNLGSGYTLEVRNFDDVSFPLGRHDPNQGAKNVRQMLNTSCIVAMVGPFNSSVAAAEIPLAANGGLAMISPSNNNPGLTLQPYAAANNINYAALHPAGKPDVYFRLPGNDLVQGQFLADYTYTSLRARKVYIVDDQETYGVELADFFTQEFQKQGGVILGRDTLSESLVGLPTVAARAAAAHPDVVFYGGVTSGGGDLLKAQLVLDGYTGPFVGGDGIAQDPRFIHNAGSAANGTCATSGLPDLSTFTPPIQRVFITDYRSAFGADPDPYSALAYDAAGIIIQAIRSLIQAGKAPTRAAIRDAIQPIQYTGLTGHITFDQNGDNAGQRVFSVYKVQGEQWVFVQQVSV